MRRSIWLGAVVCVLGLGTESEAAPNLLTNPDFSQAQMDAGWLAESASIATAWDMRDLNDDANSGSLLVTNTSANGSVSGGNGPSQCLAVVPGVAYDAGVWIFVPEGQMRTGFGNVTAFWYDEASCTGTVSFAAGSNSVTTGAFWQLSATITQPAPASARSAEFILLVNKQEADGSFEVQFDEALFVPEPSPTLLGFGALAALAALRRGSPRHSSVRGRVTIACRLGSASRYAALLSMGRRSHSGFRSD